MNPAVLASYLGHAALYGGMGAALVFLLLRIAGVAVDGRHALTLALAGFFLALTQYPLPDPATMACSDGGAAVILRPFAILEHFERIWRRSLQHGWSAELWLGNQVVQATVMNFALCAAIGAALARHATGWRMAVGAGALLSGGAELAQLTALFGLYPCAWRTFEVDDLILNIGGLLTGFTLMRRWRRDLPE